MIETEILAGALRSSKLLKRLSLPSLSLPPLDDHGFRTIIEALAENKSLCDLDVSGIPLSDKSFTALCDTLGSHQSLRRLELDDTTHVDDDRSPNALLDGRNVYRMRALASMLRSNTVLQEIYLSDEDINSQVYHESVLPRLEMNRSSFEDQRTAVRKASRTLRPQLVGRALSAVRHNPRLIFQFLTENADVVSVAAREDCPLAHLRKRRRKV
jgi:hypothetical protein